MPYRIVNNFENDSFLVEEFTKVFNEKTGQDSIVFMNHTNKEMYFLNGKIASDFLMRVDDIKKKDKIDLKSKKFEVFFIVGQIGDKTFKTIRGINLSGDSGNLKFDF